MAALSLSASMVWKDIKNASNPWYHTIGVFPQTNEFQASQYVFRIDQIHITTSIMSLAVAFLPNTFILYNEKVSWLSPLLNMKMVCQARTLPQIQGSFKDPSVPSNNLSTQHPSCAPRMMINWSDRLTKLTEPVQLDIRNLHCTECA